MGAQKNRLIETVLSSTHKICFVWQIILKCAFLYATGFYVCVFICLFLVSSPLGAMGWTVIVTVPGEKLYERKTVIISLPINLSMCLGAQMNRLIETVLLSTHNICFG